MVLWDLVTVLLGHGGQGPAGEGKQRFVVVAGQIAITDQGDGCWHRHRMAELVNTHLDKQTLSQETQRHLGLFFTWGKNVTLV